MRRSISATIVFFLIHFCISLNASDFFSKHVADSTVPRTYAMIMGISEYKYIRPLAYADDDAELLRDYLKSPAGGSLSDTNIYFLKNDKALQAAFFIKGLAWLDSKKLQKGDKLYLYLAGHGDAINEDEFFFLAFDCNPAGDKNNYLLTGTVPLYTIKSRMKRLVQKGVDVLFILDACRTNENPGGKEGLQMLNQAITEQKVGDIMMLAASSGQESLEDGTIGTGHGLFTYFLVDGLNGMADSMGVADKKVTLGELKAYVDKSVSEYALQKYKKKQDPVFCCDENDQKVLAVVDSAYFRKWILGKQLRGQLQGSGTNSSLTSRSVKTRGNYLVSDTIITGLYNKFNNAIKELNLTGHDGSAESIFNEMNKLDPANSLTFDAKITLATEFVNFAQGKINLYLDGRDVSSIQRIRSQLDADDKSDEVSNSLDRMEKVARQDFSDVAVMLEKAIVYAAIDDDDYLRKLKAQNFFFKAQGYFEKGGSVVGLKQAIQDATMAYLADPNAAYITNTLAALEIDNNKPDSAIYFARKAVATAPLWRYPYVNIANAYSKKNMSDSALVYFRKALVVDAARADAYVDLGYFYFQQRKLDSAQANYNRALFLEPENVPANNNMGWLMRETRQFDQALIFFRKCLKYDPSFFNAYNGISRVFTDMKMFDSARTYYQKAMQSYPDKLITNNYLGQFYQEMNQVDSARNYFVQAAAVDPSYDAPLINLGKLYAQTNQIDSAKYYYRRAIDLNAKNFRGYNQLGLMFVDLKMFDSANYYYRKGLEVNPNNAIVLNNLGLSFNEQDRYDSASFYFRKIININPENFYAYNNLGYVFSKMKKYDSAQIYFAKALALKSDLPSAMFNMGRVYHAQKDYRTALYYYESELDIHPDDTKALLGLEEAFKQLDQADSTIYYYKKSVEKGVVGTYMYINIGRLYFNSESYDSATHWYIKSIEYNPANPIGYNNMGAVYMALQQYDSAIVYNKRAVAVDSTYMKGHFDMGIAYHLTEQFDSAIVHFRKAIILNPKNAVAYYYLATSYARNKKDEEALLCLQQAIERGYNSYEYIVVDPDLETIRKYSAYKTMMKKYFPKKYKPED